MRSEDRILVERAKKAAEEVLVHNMHGPYRGLPRVAGWGYPEPYTRDLMIATLGILLVDNKDLIQSVRKCLETLAKTQSRLGHIPSLVHDTEARGASDTTPLFLIALALCRRVTGDQNFLEREARKAMIWMEYQSPSDRVLVAQLPTSDWRDEQWVLGYGLFVNTLVYSYLRLFGQDDRASQLKDTMAHFALDNQKHPRDTHEGLALRRKPYYALWSYKIFKNERFDLLGNSLAILTGIASPTRAKAIIAWIEKEALPTLAWVV